MSCRQDLVRAAAPPRRAVRRFARTFGVSLRALAACLLVGGCNAPHPLDGLDRSGRAAAGAHRFHVNWNAEKAQATRLNPVWRPDFAEVAAAAVVAVERVTGCAARSAALRGDVALVHVPIDCRDAR